MANPLGSKLRHGHTAGGTKSRAYEAWSGMRRRCNNKNRPDYHYYGGRGISYDPDWDIFESFLIDMGEPPIGMTLERIDNNKGYSKHNCKWASRREQRLNTRDVRMLTFNGLTLCISDWERKLGFCRVGLTMRLRRGWSVARALSTPMKKMT